MPDKEFDKLFREKFEDAEIEPSANLWANIEQQLEPKRKKTIPLYWMAAAAVTLSISAMLVFQKKEVIQLHGDTDPVTQIEQPIPVTSAPAESIVSIEDAPKVAVAKYTAAPKTATKKEAVQMEINNPSENILASVQPSVSNDRLLIKPMEPKPLDVAPIKEVVNDKSVVFAAIPTTEKTIDEVVDTEKPTERKGIKNVGDLVNYVVEKVDKRDKKLLRFNTDDDDNSSLIGINIGFLKLNKKDK